MDDDTRFCLAWLRRHCPESPVLRYQFDERPDPPRASERAAAAPVDPWEHIEIETAALGDTITHSVDETGEHVTLEILEGAS